MSLIPELPPWFDDIKAQLGRLRDSDQLPHALGIAGGHGRGGDHFSGWVQASLLCLTPRAGGACGDCRSCRLLAAGTHPDTRQAGPEGKGEQIRVAPVRELIEFAQGTRQTGAHKVIWLSRAERLNTAASNALLKLLEEPPAGTVLILEVRSVARLLPTLRSRLQIWRLPLPDQPEALQWLVSQGVEAREAEHLLPLAFGEPWQALADAGSGLASNREQAVGALVRHLSHPDPYLTGVGPLLDLPAEYLLRTWDNLLHEACRWSSLRQLPDTEESPSAENVSALRELLQRYTEPRFWITLYDRLDRLQAAERSDAHLQWRALLETFLLETARLAHRYPSIPSRSSGPV